MSRWKFPLFSIGGGLSSRFFSQYVSYIPKFSYVPFTRRVRLRSSLSFSFSLILKFVSPLIVSFTLSSRSTHMRWNIARSSKRSFAVRDTRVNIHAPVVVAFRCIFTPESSLPRYIFIRCEWYVTVLPPIQRMAGRRGYYHR